MWHRGSQADYTIGEVVKEKSTGLEGVVVNACLNLYRIESAVSSGNAFARSVRLVTRACLEKDYVKEGRLEKRAENEPDSVDQAMALADFSQLWEEYDQTGSELKLLEHASHLDNLTDEADRRMMVNEKLAEDTKKALSLITETASKDKYFGERFMFDMTNAAGDDIKELRNKENALGKELEPKLMKLFDYSEKIKRSISRYLYIEFRQDDEHTGRIWLTSINSLVSYLMELNLSAEGASTNLSYKVPNDLLAKSVNHVVLPQSYLRTLNELKNEVFSQVPKYGGSIQSEQDYNTMMEKINQNVKKIQDTTKEVKSSLKFSSSVYKVACGQPVSDPVYGKGTVTNVDHLQDGFVSVSFGPGMEIRFYDAGKIAAPENAPLPTFQCPMDYSEILADECLNGHDGGACAFLRFVDEKPTCSFQQEYEKQMAEKQASADAEAKKAADLAAKNASTQDRLNASLKTASFNDHGFYAIAQYTPVVENGLIRKKNASVYGKVLERNADSSILVQWFNGPKSLVWETEIEGVDSETQTKLRKAHII